MNKASKGSQYAAAPPAAGAAGSGDDPAGDLGDRNDAEAPVLDDEPDAETMSEEMDRAEQGTENEEGTEAQSVQTEEEVA